MQDFEEYIYHEGEYVLIIIIALQKIKNCQPRAQPPTSQRFYAILYLVIFITNKSKYAFFCLSKTGCMYNVLLYILRTNRQSDGKKETT